MGAGIPAPSPFPAGGENLYWGEPFSYSFSQLDRKAVASVRISSAIAVALAGVLVLAPPAFVPGAAPSAAAEEIAEEMAQQVPGENWGTAPQFPQGASGGGSNELPGEAPAESHAETTGGTPGGGSGETPAGEAPGDAPAETPDEVLEETPEEVPGQVPDEAAGQVPAPPSDTPVRIGLAWGQTAAWVSSTAGLWVVVDGTLHAEVRPGAVVGLHALDGGVFVDAVPALFTDRVRLVPKPPGYISFQGRSYRGEIEAVPTAGGRLSVVNVVNLEEYLLAVVPAEMEPNWPAEALKAQAVAARTYTLANLGKRSADGFDLRNTTDDQVYRGIQDERPSTTAAVLETKGQVVTYEGRLIATYYHSSSGGHTENNENVWTGGTPLGYLRGVRDFDDVPGKKYTSWSYDFTIDDFSQALRQAGFPVGTVTAVVPGAPGASGRPTTWTVVGTEGTRTLTMQQMRTALGLPAPPREIALSGPDSPAPEPEPGTGPDAATPPGSGTVAEPGSGTGADPGTPPGSGTGPGSGSGPDSEIPPDVGSATGPGPGNGSAPGSTPGSGTGSGASTGQSLGGGPNPASGQTPGPAPTPQPEPEPEPEPQPQPQQALVAVLGADGIPRVRPIAGSQVLGAGGVTVTLTGPAAVASRDGYAVLGVLPRPGRTGSTPSSRGDGADRDGQGSTSAPGATAGSGGASQSGATSGSGATPASGATSGSGATPASGATSGSGVAPAFGATSDSGAAPVPGPASTPGAASDPPSTPTPGTASGTGPSPEPTAGQGVTPPPESASGSGGSAPRAEAAPTGVTVTGSGYGHGVGLSQWGAYGMALQGKTYVEILTYFYTGTKVETR